MVFGDLMREAQRAPFPPWVGVAERIGKGSVVRRSVGGDESRASHEGLADVAEVAEVRPCTGEEHADATSRHFDAGGNFDQSHPPCTGVTFTKWVCFTAAVEVSATRTASACFNRNGILFEIVAGAFFRRRIGNLLS